RCATLAYPSPHPSPCDQWAENVWRANGSATPPRFPARCALRRSDQGHCFHIPKNASAEGRGAPWKTARVPGCCIVAAVHARRSVERLREWAADPQSASGGPDQSEAAPVLRAAFCASSATARVLRSPTSGHYRSRIHVV